MVPAGADAAADAAQGNALTRRGLLSAAALIAVGSILSRALGLVREQVIAATFGATAGTDAYVIARTVPLILYDLLVGSVITAAFVPVFVQFTGERDRRQLWRVVGAIFTIASVALTVISVLLAIFAEQLVWVLAGGFAEDQRELGTGLMRVALASVIFQGLAGVLTSVLYAQNRFALPAFAVAIYNVGVIAGVVFLAPALGLQALVLGLVLGALSQFALQAAGLRDFWRSYRPHVDLADPAVRRVLALYGPVAAGMLVTVTGYGIDRNLASHLAAGSLSAMQYATTVLQFPLGMVGLATSYAVLPTLSRYSLGDQQDAERYRDALLFGMKVILLLGLPSVVGLAALAAPTIQALFERGAFTSADTALTARVFLAYLPQLPFTALDYLLISAFYARQNTRTPVTVGVVATLLYLGVAPSVVGPLGPVGLALADAVKNSSHALILLVLLRRALPGLRLGAALVPFLVRVVPSALLMGAVVVVIWPALSGLGVLPALVASIALAAVAYGAMVFLTGVSEARTVLALVRERLVRTT